MFLLWLGLSIEDKGKFTLLYEQYFNALLLYAKSIVRSDSLAEDVVQETYRRLLENLDKVEPDNLVRTKVYLVRIASNVAKDIYTKNLKTSILDIDDYTDAISTGTIDPTWEGYDIKALVEDLERWIQELSEREQLLLRYKLLEDWSYKEIESVFDIKESTASSIISRARKKILEKFNRERRRESE